MNSTIWGLPEEVHDIVWSFCQWKDIQNFSNTNKEAIQKTIHIWVRHLEKAMPWFFPVIDKNRQIIQISHFTGIFSIDYHYHKGIPNQVNPNKFHPKNQIEYNRHIIYQILKENNNSIHMLAIIKNICVQNYESFKLTKGKYISSPIINKLLHTRENGQAALVGKVFLHTTMSAIAHKFHALFFFLETIRMRSLTQNGLEEIIHFFKNINHPSIIKHSISPIDLPRHQKIHAEITNFLLSYAAICGNTIATQFLLSRCRNINASVTLCQHPDPISPLLPSVYAGANKGMMLTPLICAIANCKIAREQPNIVRMLLNAKADPNLCETIGSYERRTPLEVAINTGNIMLVKTLLYAKASPTLLDKWKREEFIPDSPLMVALANTSPKLNQLDLICLFMAHIPNLNSHDFLGLSPLSYAAGFGKIFQIQMLLNSKADVNWMGQNEENPSPLMIAAMRHHWDAIRALISAKADPNVSSYDGATALQYALQFYTRVPAYKYSKPVNEHYVSQTVSLLLQLKADPNDYHNYCLNNRAPLLTRAAASRGVGIGAVRALLNANADCNRADSNGRTPLMRAAQGKRTDVVAALLEAHADCSLVDVNGTTALMYAMELPLNLFREMGKLKCLITGEGVKSIYQIKHVVKVLIEYGAIAHTVNNTGNTALSIFNRHFNAIPKKEQFHNVLNELQNIRELLSGHVNIDSVTDEDNFVSNSFDIFNEPSDLLDFVEEAEEENNMGDDDDTSLPPSAKRRKPFQFVFPT